MNRGHIVEREGARFEAYFRLLLVLGRERGLGGGHGGGLEHALPLVHADYGRRSLLNLGQKLLKDPVLLQRFWVENPEKFLRTLHSRRERG